MNVILNHSSMVPIYEQLSNNIKACVVSGELAPGAVLPSVRALAAELQISALTVKKAYDRLEEEQVIVTVHGKGSYVAENDPRFISEARRRQVESRFADAIVCARSAGLTNEDIRELIGILMEEQS